MTEKLAFDIEKLESIFKDAELRFELKMKGKQAVCKTIFLTEDYNDVSCPIEGRVECQKIDARSQEVLDQSIKIIEDFIGRGELRHSHEGIRFISPVKFENLIGFEPGVLEDAEGEDFPVWAKEPVFLSEAELTTKAKHEPLFDSIKNMLKTQFPDDAEALEQAAVEQAIKNDRIFRDCFEVDKTSYPFGCKMLKSDTVEISFIIDEL